MNTLYISFLILVLFVLLLFIGFFTSSETAYLSLTKIKLRRLVESKTKHSSTVEKLKNNMESFLTVVLIGTNFLNSLSTAIATMLAVSIFGEKGVGIATVVVAFFVTVVGQIIPKTIASIYPEKISLFASEPLLFLQRIFFPIVKFFELLSHLAVKLIELIVKPSTNVNITEEEIKTLISVGETEGTIQTKEGQMLNKIIKFNDLVVSDIMKHRSLVSMVSESATQEEVIAEFLRSGFSTLAVYKENRENVVGVLNYKTILYNSSSENLGENYAKQNMKAMDFIPGTLSVFELLQKFRQSEHKFAVVLNEQGDTYGIVTIEDIMKLVFNRMTDENSKNSEPAENKIKPISPRVFIIQGDIQLDDINAIMKLDLKSEEFNTFGGWVLEQFGHLPSIGEVFIDKRVIYMVEDISKRRIVTVRVTIPS